MEENSALKIQKPVGSRGTEKSKAETVLAESRTWIAFLKTRYLRYCHLRHICWVRRITGPWLPAEKLFHHLLLSKVVQKALLERKVFNILYARKGKIPLFHGSQGSGSTPSNDLFRDQMKLECTKWCLLSGKCLTHQLSQQLAQNLLYFRFPLGALVPTIQATLGLYLLLQWVFKKEFAYPQSPGLGRYPLALTD